MERDKLKPMDSKVLAHWTSGGVVVAWDDRLADPAHPQWATAPFFPPVRIREDAWPVIAYARYRGRNDGGAYESQATRRWHVDVRVRRHEDGRAIVYGVYDYSTAVPGERNFVAQAGLLLDQDANLVEAIRTVGKELTRAAREAGHDYDAHIAATARDCIEDLLAS